MFSWLRLGTNYKWQETSISEADMILQEVYTEEDPHINWFVMKSSPFIMIYSPKCGSWHAWGFIAILFWMICLECCNKFNVIWQRSVSVIAACLNLHSDLSTFINSTWGHITSHLACPVHINFAGIDSQTSKEVFYEIVKSKTAKEMGWIRPRIWVFRMSNLKEILKLLLNLS